MPEPALRSTFHGPRDRPRGDDTAGGPRFWRQLKTTNYRLSTLTLGNQAFGDCGRLEKSWSTPKRVIQKGVSMSWCDHHRLGQPGITHSMSSIAVRQLAIDPSTCVRTQGTSRLHGAHSAEHAQLAATGWPCSDSVSVRRSEPSRAAEAAPPEPLMKVGWESAAIKFCRDQCARCRSVTGRIRSGER